MTPQLTELQQQTLRSAVDRIIPPDDYPGAWDVGTGDDLARQFEGDLALQLDTQPGARTTNCFEINGSRGSIVFNLERMNELELFVNEGPESGFRTIQATNPAHPYMKSWWPQGHIIGYEHTFIHTVFDLLKAVDEQRLPSPNFEDGVKNQRVLDAVARSAQSQRWETV